jgi:hypothetical protein
MMILRPLVTISIRLQAIQVEPIVAGKQEQLTRMMDYLKIHDMVIRLRLETVTRRQMKVITALLYPTSILV